MLLAWEERQNSSNHPSNSHELNGFIVNLLALRWIGLGVKSEGLLGQTVRVGISQSDPFFRLGEILNDITTSVSGRVHSGGGARTMPMPLHLRAAEFKKTAQQFASFVSKKF